MEKKYFCFFQTAETGKQTLNSSVIAVLTTALGPPPNLNKNWVTAVIDWSRYEKWNESGFRPPLCTYRLNWARRTSWGWWDDWDDTVLQTQDSKFEPWRSEAEHATSRSQRPPTILTFTRGWGRNIICFFQTAETGNRTPNWRERQQCWPLP